MRPRDIERSVPLIDIEINRSGDGRTVTAYAATFGNPYEVRDQDGHYDEVINAAAFNRAIGSAERLRGIQVVYNHGMTLWRTPSERYSMPLGVPLEVRSEPKGLLTVTRYSKTPLGDEVLELIADGAIRSQSFRGPTIRSAKPVPGKNGRPMIERLQLGLVEYGPTPFPANNSAAIMAVRSSLLAAEVGDLSPEERAELLALLQQAEPHLGGSSVATEPQEQLASAPVPPAPAAPVAGPSVDVDAAELAYLQLANPS